MNVSGDDFDLERGQHGSDGGYGRSGGSGGTFGPSVSSRLGFRTVRIFVDGRVRHGDNGRRGLVLRLDLRLAL